VQPIDVDVRFVAATNKILRSEVKSGRFREDLYYRLQVIAINLPALRERGDDVMILVEHFIRKLNARYERAISGVSREVEQIFLRYPWPGNVRELENLLERIFILEEENQIVARHLPDRILRSARGEWRRAEGEAATGASDDIPADFHAATAQFQARLIRQALGEAGGNLPKAAETLKLSRHALRHQMIKLGIQ
jgi:DNA-binding NtrC family response regulator